MLRNSSSLGAVLTLILLAMTANAATFEEANQLYEKGKFEHARAAYETVAASGGRTANLFFNLGNAEYRLGHAGRAALDYERALALDPAHPEARMNLNLVREQSGARL